VNGSPQSFVTNGLIELQKQDASLTRDGGSTASRCDRLHLAYTQVIEITDFRNRPDRLVNVPLTSQAQA